MLRPFLKWAGGKRWLLNNSSLHLPIEYNKYFEPFLGSGALFFFLMPKMAHLSDINNGLIELYEIIKDQPEDLAKLIMVHHKNHSKDYYYKVRKIVPDCRLERAARLLYLNRTCWNGLYRVNYKGQFNVPIGTKTSVVLATDDFSSISEALKTTKLVCSDFEKTIDLTMEGDFLFVDPPYTVQHNNNKFIKYNEKLFSWDDQERLRNALLRAKDRKVQIIVTNADHPSIKNLYKKVGQYHQLSRQSVLAGNSDKRGSTTEAMFVANIH
jgi:DNA adenine methylase